MTALPLLGGALAGSARGINASGQVVGGCYANANQGLVLLKGLVAGLDFWAVGMNDAGVIVGNACTTPGYPGTPHAVLWNAAAAPQSPREQLAQLRDELVNDVLPTLAGGDQTKLQDAINHLNKALEDSRWLDDSHLKPGPKGESVFDETKAAVAQLKELRDRNKSGVAREVFQACIDQILAVDRELAVIALDEAKAGGGNAGKIKTAEAELAKGDQEAGRDHPDKAIDHYKNSWKNAIAA